MSDPDHNPCVMTIVVTKATVARLQLVAAEQGQTEDKIWQIASDAVDEAALQAFRNREDDPAKSQPEVSGSAQ